MGYNRALIGYILGIHIGIMEKNMETTIQCIDCSHCRRSADARQVRGDKGVEHDVMCMLKDTVTTGTMECCSCDVLFTQRYSWQTER